MVTWIMYLVNTLFRRQLNRRPINPRFQQGLHLEVQSNTIQIHAVREFSLQRIIKLHQQAQLLYAEMEHIVLAVVVEVPALITVVLQDGYKRQIGRGDNLTTYRYFHFQNWGTNLRHYSLKLYQNPISW